jgi:hypothetical protein
MWAGIISNRDANGADARVGLHALECHAGGGKHSQVGMTVDTSQGVIGRGSIAIGTGLHNSTPGILNLIRFSSQ